MAYSSAQRCFEANVIETRSPDAQNVAFNLSKGLSELTLSVAADIQELRNQLRDLRKELDILQGEKKRRLYL